MKPILCPVLGILALTLGGVGPLAEGEAMRLSPADANLGAGWRFSAGLEFPGAKGALTADADGVLHLRFDFASGGAYVGAYRDLETPAALESVTFRVRKPAEARITVRATDSGGQTFQKSLQYAHDDWQAVAFDLDNWTGHYGGPDDGVLRPPVRSLGFLVEKEGLESNTGEVLLADIAAEPLSAEKAAQTEPVEHRGEYVVTDFGNDAGFGAGPHSTLKDHVWTIDFSKTDSSSLNHCISLLGTSETLILTIRGGAKGNVLRFGIGSHFQGFSRTVGVLDGGPQTFTFPVPPEGWQYGGGENDGKARHPLRVTSISLDRGEGPAEPTPVELIDLRCVTTVRRSKAVTLFGTLKAGDGSAEASCKAWNLLDTDLEGTLTVTFRDWEDHVIDEQRQPWTLPANGVPVTQTCAATVPAGLNFFDVEGRFEAKGQQDATTRASYTRPVEPRADAALNPASPWGMGLYLYRYGDSPAGYAEMDRAAALGETAGVKWSREEFSWARTEPEPGNYDFHFYDQVVTTAQRHGISVYGLLAYWSSWTEPYTEKGIDDFCRWARACVAHFKDRVKHWEIYNEPNIFFWQGPRELYPVLVARCCAAIKEEDPEAQVLAISTAGIDRKFIEMCLEKGATFDVLTVHPYRPVLSERGFIQQLRDTAAVVDNRPIWITEMGWNTAIAGGVDERSQAQLLARCYLAAVASGACQNISWYDFRNDGTDPFYFESNFGVVRRDMTPKPAYRALTSVCRTLASGAPRPRTDFGQDVYALEADNALALWTSATALDATVRVESGDPRVTNLMGEPLVTKRDGAQVTLRLRPYCPVFLENVRVSPVSVDKVAVPVETLAEIRF